MRAVIRRAWFRITKPYKQLRINYEYYLYCRRLGESLGMEREVFDNEFWVHSRCNWGLGRVYVQADAAERINDIKRYFR